MVLLDTLGMGILGPGLWETAAWKPTRQGSVTNRLPNGAERNGATRRLCSCVVPKDEPAVGTWCQPRVEVQR